MNFLNRLFLGTVIALLSTSGANAADTYVQDIGFVPPAEPFTKSWTESLQKAVFGGYNWTAAPSTDGTELVMTPDIMYRHSWAVLNSSPICAREYELSVEFNAGTRTGTDGGYLMGFETKSIFHNTPNISDRYYGVRFYMNSDYRHNKALIPNNNAFQIWSNESSLQEFAAMPRPVGAFNPLVATAAPFQLKGAGWLKVTVHYSDGDIEARVSNGTVAATLKGSHSPTPGLAFYPLFVADTGSWRNIHKFRNYSIRVIRGDTCDGINVLTRVARLKEEIKLRCGELDRCEALTEFQSCALSTVESLRTTETVAEDDYAAIIMELNAKAFYCNGLSECRVGLAEELERARTDGYQTGYSAGFEAGASSIDTDAIRQSGFEAGVLSIDQNAIREAGRLAGFEAGVLSVDQEAIYQRGLADGRALCRPADPLIAVRANIDALCPCAAAKSHGAYVQCVTAVLTKFRTGGIISEAVRREIQAEAAHSECGKRPKKRRS